MIAYSLNFRRRSCLLLRATLSLTSALVTHKFVWYWHVYWIKIPNVTSSMAALYDCLLRLIHYIMLHLCLTRTDYFNYIISSINTFTRQNVMSWNMFRLYNRRLYTVSEHEGASGNCYTVYNKTQIIVDQLTNVERWCCLSLSVSLLHWLANKFREFWNTKKIQKNIKTCPHKLDTYIHVTIDYTPYSTQLYSCC